MTKEELNYIKDAFSQIIDDIAGNPDWHEAARAVASDLGTLERKLEEKVSPLPSNLDEVAKEFARTTFTQPYSETPEKEITIIEPDKLAGFKAGAKWMAEQGVIREGVIKGNGDDIAWVDYPDELPTALAKHFKSGDKVIVQIRKK